ncbi:hypothetical protein [endosymbiont GvMRE of Glomus versiforme]|uniref:hypothetical protein n=1 Tax=endosymbiont GvMRE of Glomus versiforme TaxID=2039283 RepID=UPI000EE68360|nr:hypothetical protein [endosymbiont GvMRE of Glomus versiforme]RHZ37784.1 hypothetical protein GvMRE_I1g327 [endosymbiont GvMRE of Glomus versiforme]
MTVGISELVERTLESVKKEDEKLREELPEVWKSFTTSEKIILKVIKDHFIPVVRETLKKGEEIEVKNFFTIKRQKTKVKGNKRCDKHEKAVESYNKANKGKGIEGYAGSPIWRKLMAETRSCNSCKSKKKQMKDAAKLTTRISFKPSPNFWIITKKKAATKPRPVRSR